MTLVFSLLKTEQHPHSSKCLIYEEQIFTPNIGLPQGKLHMINYTDEGVGWAQTILPNKQAFRWGVFCVGVLLQ